MNEPIKDFTDLIAWKKSHEIVILIYAVTKNFPSDQKFSLVNQMQRAVVSVTSNVAEGFGRFTYKEKAHFYYQASGSLAELKNQTIISRDLSYIDTEIYSELDQKINNTHKLIHGLISKTKSLSSIPVTDYFKSQVSNL